MFSIIEEACDFIVKLACLNTWSGNYLISTEEVAIATHFTKEEIENKYWEEILHSLQCREEILDAEFDKENLLFDVICALDYCPNYQWIDGDEEVFNCSYDEWKKLPVKQVKSHGDLPYKQYQEKENKMKRQKNKKVVVDATIVWKALKPQQYNGFMCGYGYHGKKGYNRNAEKRKPLDE